MAELRQQAKRAGFEIVAIVPEAQDRRAPYATAQVMVERLRPELSQEEIFTSPLAGLILLQSPAHFPGKGSAPERVARREPVSRDAAFGVSTEVLPRSEEVRAELLDTLKRQTRRAPVLLTMDPGEFVDAATLSWISETAGELAHLGVVLAVSLDEEEEGAIASWHRALDPLPGRWERLPAAPPSAGASAARRTRERFHALPAPAQRAVLAAAVAGPDATLPVLQFVLGEPSAKVQELLRPALESGLLRREDPVYRTGDPQLLRDLQRTVPAAELRRLHLEVAKALKLAYPSPWGKVLFRLADHWRAAGSEAETVPALIAAVQEMLRRGAYDLAAEEAKEALLLSQRIPSAEGRALEERTYAVLGLALEMQGDHPGGVQAYEKAVRIAKDRKAGVARWGPYLNKMLRLEAGIGGREELMEQRVQEAIAEASRSRATTVEAEFHSGLAHRFLMRGQREEGLREAERAIACAEVEKDPPTLARSLRMLALALFTGESTHEEQERAQALLQRTIETVSTERAGAELAFAFDDLASLACAGKDEALAVQWGERSVRQARRACSRGDLLLMLGNFAEHQLHAKDLPGATRTLEEIRTFADRYHLPENHFARQQLMLSDGLRLFLAGDRAGARSQLERTVELGERIGARDIMGQALAYLVVQAVEAGEWGPARTYLRRMEKEGLRRALYSMNRELLDAAVAKIPAGR